MQYILTQAEFDALTPVKRLQERNEALEVAREIILELSGIICADSYCSDCPIDHTNSKNEKLTKEVSEHICIAKRTYPK